MVQLFKNVFAFIGVKFQDYCKKFESLLSICRIFTFSLIQEYHFNDHFVRFQHFGLRYFDSLIYICKYQSWFRVNQRWVSAVERCSALFSAENPMFQSKENQRWTALIQSCFSLKQRCSALKQRWIFQFWTALIQRKSELISSVSELISADVYHVLWISAEKRQNYETALFRADYLWDFNPGFNCIYAGNTSNLPELASNSQVKLISTFEPIFLSSNLQQAAAIALLSTSRCNFPLSKMLSWGLNCQWIRFWRILIDYRKTHVNIEFFSWGSGTAIHKESIILESFLEKNNFWRH